YLQPAGITAAGDLRLWQLSPADELPIPKPVVIPSGGCGLYLQPACQSEKKQIPRRGERRERRSQNAPRNDTATMRDDESARSAAGEIQGLRSRVPPCADLK